MTRMKPGWKDFIPLAVPPRAPEKPVWATRLTVTALLELQCTAVYRVVRQGEVSITKYVVIKNIKEYKQMIEFCAVEGWKAEFLWIAKYGPWPSDELLKMIERTHVKYKSLVEAREEKKRKPADFRYSRLPPTLLRTEHERIFKFLKSLEDEEE